jgi:hypothetical protein
MEDVYKFLCTTYGSCEIVKRNASHLHFTTISIETTLHKNLLNLPNFKNYNEKFGMDEWLKNTLKMLDSFYNMGDIVHVWVGVLLTRKMKISWFNMILDCYT